jgi:CRISPR-associated protein Csb1
MPDNEQLTYTTLKEVVAGSAAAFRLTLKLEAVSPKVFPPTYEGGKYATESRRINGQEVPCVLLDSVPSQANRMELALQDAWEGGEIEIPVVSADFTAVENPGVPKVTSLQAPHRIADAILRDSTVEEGGKAVQFRKSSIGKQLDLLSAGYATPLLQYGPHSLVFGMWDSTGNRGGLGVKFARAVVSEIVGVNSVPGVTTSSRIDPLNIQKLVDKEDEEGVAIYKSKDGGWTLNKGEAEQRGGKPVLFGKKGKPSEINHGNVTPDIVYRRDKNRNLVLGDAERPVMMVVINNDEDGGHKYVIRDERKPIPLGGFTIDYAEQTTVLSLPALRRLRFPAKQGEKSTPEADVAARSYLAALGLLGATLAVEAGYDLRSRCLLRATDPVRWHLLGRPGEADKLFDLPKEAAIALYKKALAAVREVNLPVETNEITLTPLPGLVTLVRRSMELAAAEAGTEG